MAEVFHVDIHPAARYVDGLRPIARVRAKHVSSNSSLGAGELAQTGFAWL